MGFQNLEEQLRVLQKKNGELQAALRSTPSRGNTTARDDLYGKPTTDAQRVALANQSVTWFNTDTGWQESYYAVTGLTGLTARGLVAGTASGWYPTGYGPRAVLYSAGGQARTSAQQFTNYNSWGVAKSYRNAGNDWFTRTAVANREGELNMHTAGRYRITSSMGVQGGSGTAVLSTRVNNSGGTGRAIYQYPAALQANYGNYFVSVLAEVDIPANCYAFQYNDSGSLQIGQSETFLSVEYLGPLLASR